jgi:hypothetical protein
MDYQVGDSLQQGGATFRRGSIRGKENKYFITPHSALRYNNRVEPGDVNKRGGSYEKYRES